jgi:hypothetical protein
MSVEMESIESILGGSTTVKGEEPAPPAVETKVETPVEKPEASGHNRDESGRFAKPEVKPEEKPALTKADVAAIMDERRKRQDAERELAQLRQNQPQKQKTDFFENPEAAVSEHLSERLSPLEKTVMELRLELAKTKMPDFDDAALAFFQVAQSDPILRHQADTAPDMYAFIYREGKRIKELGDVDGDITKYREKVTAESRIEIAKRDEQIATLTAQMAALQKAQDELAAVPRSLNTEPSTPAKAADEDPDDIKSIARFGNSKR